MEAKGKIEKEKKAEELDRKIKAKKITEADKQIDLKVFDQMLENRIQNEIAKRIDKAHNYSFNLANYKSAISDSQIIEWTEALKHIQPNGASTLDEVYKKLSNSKPENILPYLLKLNPVNALEADIVREYVSNLDNELILKHKELNVIKEILKSGAKYPMVKLKDYLILNENKIKPNKTPDVNYKVLGVSNEIGIFLNEKLQAEETNQSYYLVAKNEFCYNPYRINVGSIGLNTNDYDNQIISGAYIIFACKEDELNPKYLDALFNSSGFKNYVNEKASGGVRMNFKFEDMEAWEIPLPSIDEQNVIVAKIEKQKAIIEGVVLVLKNSEFKIEDILINGESYLFSDIVETIDAGINFSKADLSVNKQGIPYIKMQNLQNGRIDLDNFELAYVEEKIETLERYILEKDDLLLNVRNSFELVGKMAIYQGIPRNAIYNHMLLRIRLKDFALPSFVNYMFQTVELNEKLNHIKKGSTSIWAVYQKDLNKVSLKLPDLETQQKIVDELDVQSQILESLRKMKIEAEKKIGKILADVWGVEFVETIKMEVADEQEN